MLFEALSRPHRLGSKPRAPIDLTGPARSGRWWLPVVLWTFLFAIALGNPTDCSAARWYEDYERAVELIKDGQCSREAIQLLGAAVVDKPKPKRKARTIAVQTVDYLPYYQMARAHLACGDADSAMHYIKQSRKRKVADAAALGDLERRAIELGNSTSAGAKPEIDIEELSNLAKTAQDTIRQASASAERVKDRREIEWLAGFFAMNEDALSGAHDDLTTAQEALNDGTLKQDRASIINAELYASRALVVFTGLESEMAALRPPEPTPEPVVARPTPRPTLSSPPTQVPTRAVAVPTPRPTPRSVRSDSGTTTQAPLEFPASLRQAASDYVMAGYEEVVRGLEPDVYPATKQQAAAHLLRAAAHFAIYCLDGRRDDGRLNLVQSDIDRSREIDPTLSPDPLIFSPEFVELFR